jgi:hypothetical protein
MKAKETLNHTEIAFQEIAFHSNSFINSDNKNKPGTRNENKSLVKKTLVFSILIYSGVVEEKQKAISRKKTPNLIAWVEVAFFSIS